MAARQEQMTGLNSVKDFLAEFDSALTLIPGVTDDIPKSTGFPMSNEVCTPSRISSRTPQASLSRLVSLCTVNATVKQYQQGKPIPRGIPES